ncbi:uncharacterized protein METZ01_LOCUS101015 [marine metagenome]|uniref:NIF system FeS cluster assembly NifU N-terminal domain-containing protein n=1 Tax=marine metagenome TaxID=408172 RepID=A0A381W782_9ZZZZ
MPCKDTKSQISIVLDSKDHLLSFEYSKMTCNKEIDGGSGFRDYCIGKPVDILSKLEFNDLINVFQLCDTESQFLLFLEWSALSAALDQYQGKLIPNEENRYQIATIAYESDQVEIKQIVLEPPEMPKIIPCRKR